MPHTRSSQAALKQHVSSSTPAAARTCLLHHVFGRQSPSFQEFPRFGHSVRHAVSLPNRLSVTGADFLVVGHGAELTSVSVRSWRLTAQFSHPARTAYRNCPASEELHQKPKATTPIPSWSTPTHCAQASAKTIYVGSPGWASWAMPVVRTMPSDRKALTCLFHWYPKQAQPGNRTTCHTTEDKVFLIPAQTPLETIADSNPLTFMLATMEASLIGYAP